MNLAQTLHAISISAGGPGSGRKPGFGYGADKTAAMAKFHRGLQESHGKEAAKDPEGLARGKEGYVTEAHRQQWASDQHGQAAEHFERAGRHYAAGNDAKGDVAMNKGYHVGGFAATISYGSSKGMSNDQHKELYNTYGERGKGNV